MQLNTEDRIENAVIVAVLAFVALLVGSAMIRADESTEYYRAKSAAAIAIADDWPPPKPPPKPPTVSRLPVVYLYSMANCRPCEQAKLDLAAAKDLPFRIVFATPSIAVDLFPTLHWNDYAGNGRTSTGWDGLEKFKATWKVTQSPRQARLNTIPHSWPGDLRSHLRHAHGVTEALTEQQARGMHDALHSGYSLSQIRAYAQRHGLY